jgi:hypothetical protein
MSPHQAWNLIVNQLAGKRLEFPTVPKVKRDPVWFSATTDGESIFINKAIDNKPSSQLSMQRKLTYSIFEKVYPFYLKRENGERISSDVLAITVDQVYFFSLIKHLCL